MSVAFNSIKPLGRRMLSDPWLLFAPFLGLYLLIVLVLRNRAMTGDAGRYLMYAENLLRGSYAPAGSEYLWNGPGYPIFLMPFVGLNAPPLMISLANAILLYLAHVLLFKSTAVFSSTRAAALAGVAWAAHYSIYELLPLIFTEVFTLFLVCSIIFLATRIHLALRRGQAYMRSLVLLAIAIAWLILTKVLFGYVFLIGLVLIGLTYYFSTHKKALRVAALAIGLGLAFQSPYLIYTYHLTGRPLYWANSGGSSLYWMSSPYPGEYGNWDSMNRTSFEGRDLEAIAANHQADAERLKETLVGDFASVATDDLYKSLAIANIKARPLKFVQNCLANISRLFFGFPNSFQYENLKFLKYLPNLFLLPLMVFSLLVAGFNFRAIPIVLRALIAVGLIYFILSVPLSAYPRMFLAVAPIFILAIAYVLHKSVRFRLRFGR